MHIVVEYRWIYTSVQPPRGGVVVVHGSNGNTRLTMSTRSYLSSSLRFCMHFQRRITLLPQEWHEMDGYGWSWSGRGHVACDRFSRFLHAWEGWRTEKANVMARGSWNIGNIVLRVEIVELLVEERFFWKVSMWIVVMDGDGG